MLYSKWLRFFHLGIADLLIEVIIKIAKPRNAEYEFFLFCLIKNANTIFSGILIIIILPIRLIIFYLFSMSLMRIYLTSNVMVE